ncbi:ankyrin repeat-containing domain protein [Aspergillus nidulans var. acristatus]
MACERNVMSSSSGHSEYVQVPDGGRLPFLLKESGSQLGRGGYGTVTQETIAAGHFRDRNRQPNPGNKVVARKCFTNKIYFDRERVIMSLLVRGLLKHDNIVYPLAMISLESEYSILMDVADCNLEAFLTEEGKMDSTISLKSLLKQIANLAHALHSLHNPDAPGHIIHHLDLTPRNVLVKLSNDSDNPWTWMLSDFGRSKHYFNRATAESGANSAQEGPQVSSSERTSTYLPHEKKRGSYTDIWSLGCIMCRVVCRRRHGIEGLQRFDELRFKGDQDGNDYFYRGTTVNPYVKELLNQFCSSGCMVTKECGKLLKSVLSMDKDVRPKALKLYFDLEQIIDTCEESTQTEIPLEIESLRPQTPLNTGRELENSVDRSPNPVFLAIKNQGEDDALVQIKAFFCGSIRGYLSIGQYDEGLTPLCHAAEKGYTKVVKFLHDKGAQIDERDKRSNTPLMYACKKGHCDTAEYLIDQGADWNLQGEDGYTCLHFATEAKNIEIIDVLIQKQSRARVKLDANMLSTLDRTPLELHLNRQSKNARYVLIEKLIELGANAKAQSHNQNHKTAIDLARKQGDQRAMKILRYSSRLTEMC